MSDEQSITIHDGHAAVCVKYQASLYRDDVEQEALDTAYEQTVEDFWIRANVAAHMHGYSGVMAEGRSDGWCVPYRQYQHDTLCTFYYGQWPGQGHKLGYPRYPDVTQDSEERQPFFDFQRDIEALMAEVPAMFAHNLDFMLEE